MAQLLPHLGGQLPQLLLAVPPLPPGGPGRPVHVAPDEPFRGPFGPGPGGGSGAPTPLSQQQVNANDPLRRGAGGRFVTAFESTTRQIPATIESQVARALHQQPRPLTPTAIPLGPPNLGPQHIGQLVPVAQMAPAQFPLASATALPGQPLAPVAQRVPETFAQFVGQKGKVAGVQLLLALPAEAFLHGPVPRRSGLVGDVAYAGGLVGTSFASGAYKGGPIGGTIIAGVNTTRFVVRALKAEAKSLEGLPPEQILLERDPARFSPQERAQMLGAIQREALLMPPPVTGPIHDC